MVRLSVLLAGLGLALSVFSVHAQGNRRGRKYKAPPPSSTITVTVLKADNSKPIEHASVIFHPIEGDKDKGGMELRTNEDGKVTIDVIPIGDTVRLQVIAPGFQTYGKDYKIDKASMAMEVKLNRPVSQYSIYKDNNRSKNSGNGSSGEEQKAPDQNPQPK